MHSRTPPAPDARGLGLTMDIAFYVLLAASLARFLVRHQDTPRTPWVIALSLSLAVLYALGSHRTATYAPAKSARPELGVIYSPDSAPDPAEAAGSRVDATLVRGSGRTESHRSRPPGEATRGGGLDAAAAEPLSPVGRVDARAALWLGLVIAVWAVLVVLGPSFAWCAVPLLYLALRILPLRIAVGVVAALTALIVVTQLRLAGWLDPNVLLAPPAVAAVATAMFVFMRRQTERQAALIDDLVRTRAELAGSERRAGMLAERQRVAMEIHDTLAQGLSSQGMLLQAADRVWDAEPERARTHVRAAAGVTERNLAEARRFVHDLAPAELAENGSLAAALRTLADRAAEDGIAASFASDGVPVEPPARVAAALLRIAQGALANAREHGAARTVTLTLTHLGDQIVLDIADDGRGFDPHTVTAAGERGHGLPAMRARLRQLGGTLTIESAPGEGTVLSAAIPLEPS
ncbi:sensor histidine kinase [Nocardia sp. NPDC057668]|uniref:sensor histidine kinase n=1 Tax=Nocardia sp. NPDC057668 TaxID=3346202 RepID=UPI00366D6012